MNAQYAGLEMMIPNPPEVNLASHLSFAPQPLLADICMHFLAKEVPSCWYTVPASPLPMLIFILSGSVEMHDGQNLPRMTVLGASRKHYRGKAEPGSCFVSTAILPGKLSSLLGFPIEEFTNLIIDFNDILPLSVCNELSDKLHAAKDINGKVHALQDMLVRLRLSEKRYQAPLVLPPHWLNESSGELATRLGVGTRQFERRFLATYGQSLRSYKQQIRLGKSLLHLMLGQLPTTSWAECALIFGYADQAHMTRDFLRFCGHTPAKLMHGISERDPALWAFCFAGTEIKKLFIPNDDMDVVSVQDQVLA
ncbi:helix-turn-helix domain-containing protein [Undibacterium sp. TS12]|uniref:AraC family transcriptional regulator n=1 Tax=Undibacterium sp. TS12 TaxID=2908202 RepID=UPI001F4C9F51|nr:helix-turn-helix domain-containing protein [Undibacterium sp. TS12]MCH8620862.1 helix-turn-helix domain-containing protein [Undibacterium sp. TS12]